MTNKSQAKPAAQKTVRAPKPLKSAEAAVPAQKTKASAAVDAVLDATLDTALATAPAKTAAPARKKKNVVEDLAASVSAPAEKTKRAKKEKVIRDSFTMPKSDYARIATLKQKCLANGVHIKKSELLRAGLVMLENATVKNLLGVVSGLETVKTGRPAKA